MILTCVLIRTKVEIVKVSRPEWDHSFGLFLLLITATWLIERNPAPI